MNVIAFLQARMGSTRLPGKVLLDVAGAPMLVRVVNRLKQATTLTQVCIATTVEPADEQIANFCQEQGWASFRGSETDVLDRFYRAAVAFQADVVVRLTSDCPLLDREVIDSVVEKLLAEPKPDYAANVLPPRTFPRGLDVEAMTFAALEKAWREDDNPAWREHVTPFLYRRPDLFRLEAVRNPVDLSYHRWTVDTPEDLELVRRIYGQFSDDRFSWHDVLAVLEAHPDWLEINREIEQKAVH